MSAGPCDSSSAAVHTLPGGRAALAALFAGFFGLTVLFQVFTGAYTADRTLHSDSPAHYVNAVMVSEYLKTGWGTSPLRFAENYYRHYPKVSLGNSPPFASIVGGLWALVFGCSNASALSLQALIAATIAFLITRVLMGEMHAVLAVAGGILFLCHRLVIRWTSAVMIDTTVALACLVALLAWFRYTRTGRAIDSAGFGAAAAIALLTKASSAVVLVFPVATVIACRRWDLLRRGSFWIWPAVVVLPVAPWMFFTYRIARSTWHADWGWKFVSTAVPCYSGELYRSFGIVAFGLFAAGAWTRLRGSGAGRLPALWLNAAVLAAGTLVFFCAVPVALEERYLIQLIAPCVMFVAAGADAVAGLRLRGKTPGLWRAAAAAALVFAGFFPQSFRTAPQYPMGFSAVARHVMSGIGSSRESILISSDPAGEGAFVAAVVQIEPDAERIYAIRASKILAESNWTGSLYRLRADNEDDVGKILEDLGVGVIVLDRSEGRAWFPHRDQLAAVLRKFSNVWEEDRSWENLSNPDARDLAVYRVRKAFRP